METVSPIAGYRDKHNLTLEELGQRLVPAVNKSTILRWERNGVPIERVLDFERATGLSRYDLRPDVFGMQPAADPEAAE